MEELERLGAIAPDELEDHVRLRLSRGERIMGFGHRFHRRDPRVEALLQLTRTHKFSGVHLDTAQHLAEILGRLKGIAMNIEAAGGSILLDLGFDSRIGHLFIILGRSPMFAAVYLERLLQGRRPFQRIEINDLMESDE